MFDVVIVLGGICGLLMVIGGMILLYKGAITLQNASPDEAIRVEFKKVLNITTHYPALGLFIIGLAFIINSLWFSKQELAPIKLTGQVKVQDPKSLTIRISSQLTMIEPSTDGEIKADIFPHTNLLMVEVVAPGYDPPVYRKPFEIKAGKASIGSIEFRRKTMEMPTVKKENIVEPNVPLPSISSQRRF